MSDVALQPPPLPTGSVNVRLEFAADAARP